MAKTGLKIADVIKEMHRGSVEADANMKFSDLIAAVKEHGKVGTLTLRIDVRPKGNGEADITAEVNTKLPKPKPRTALFYLTEDNDLSRTDPEQADMFEDKQPEPGKVTSMPKPGETPAPQRQDAASAS